MQLLASTDLETLPINVNGITFCGFAIGPGSEHDVVLLNGMLLRAGAILPIQTSSVKITRIRWNGGSTGTGVRKCEVIGYEKPWEIAGEIGRRAPLFRDDPNATITNVAPATAVAQFPFAGRRHAAFSMSNKAGLGTTIQWEIWGRTFANPNVIAVKPNNFHQVLLASGDILDGATSGIHIGGTNDEELCDELELRANLAGAGTQTFRWLVEIVGEAGL